MNIENAMQLEAAPEPVPPREAAHRLAVRFVEALADNPEQLARFFRATGLTAETMRAVAKGPLFHLGLIDYLVREDRSRTWFCAVAGVAEEEVLFAQANLAPARAHRVSHTEEHRRRIELPPLPPRQLYRRAG